MRNLTTRLLSGTISKSSCCDWTKLISKCRLAHVDSNELDTDSRKRLLLLHRLCSYALHHRKALILYYNLMRLEHYKSHVLRDRNVEVIFTDLKKSTFHCNAVNRVHNSEMHKFIINTTDLKIYSTYWTISCIKRIVKTKVCLFSPLSRILLQISRFNSKRDERDSRKYETVICVLTNKTRSWISRKDLNARFFILKM